MSATITIQQLPIVPLPLQPTDSILLARGSSQAYQATMLSVWTIAVSAFPALPTTPVATDVMLIWRDGNQYVTPFSTVGFPSGTQMWFYSASAPAGWQIVTMSGDTMIGCVNNTNSGSNVGVFNVGGTVLKNQSAGVGSWQMQPVQLAPHQHGIPTVSGSGNQYDGYKLTTGGSQNYTPQTQRFPPTGSTDQWGTWRPITAIGVIAVKL